MRPNYEIVVAELGLLSKLREFQAVLIGTPPLGIDVSSSDIDVACSSTDLGRFCRHVGEEFGEQRAFSCEQMEVRGQAAICATFKRQAWTIELFCQTASVQDQWGVRHFFIESRLLEIEPRLRCVITHLKQAGLDTEPAFAKALGLVGDPYEAVLALETKNDLELTQLTSRAISGNA